MLHLLKRLDEVLIQVQRDATLLDYHDSAGGPPAVRSDGGIGEHLGGAPAQAFLLRLEQAAA